MTHPLTMDNWLAGLPEEARAWARRCGRPLVTLSYAQSLDGSLGVPLPETPEGPRGQGLAFSGGQSMTLTHRLRAAHAAILVGVGTVLADNPRLTVRLAEGPDPRPVVLDTHLRTPPGCALLKRDDNLPWIITGPDPDPRRAQALEARGARLVRLPAGPGGRPELAETLHWLAGQGVDSLMVEGGARVLTTFLSRRLFDYALITLAPFWLGGLNAVEQPLAQAGACPALESPQFQAYGEDLVVWGRRTERKIT